MTVLLIAVFLIGAVLVVVGLVAQYVTAVEVRPDMGQFVPLDDLMDVANATDVTRDPLIHRPELFCMDPYCTVCDLRRGT